MVRKYLREPDMVPRYASRPEKPGKLTPFEAYIGQHLQHAAPDWVPAAVLYREIQALGYTGSERLVRKYVSQIVSPYTMTYRSILRIWSRRYELIDSGQVVCSGDTARTATYRWRGLGHAVGKALHNVNFWHTCSVN